MSLATQIAALETALERGVLEVVDENGRRVRYASPEALTRALSALKARQTISANGHGLHLVPLAHGGPT